MPGLNNLEGMIVQGKGLVMAAGHLETVIRQEGVNISPDPSSLYSPRFLTHPATCLGVQPLGERLPKLQHPPISPAQSHYLWVSSVDANANSPWRPRQLISRHSLSLDAPRSAVLAQVTSQDGWDSVDG